MLVFLDFEASSLADKSYPIEIAWVFEDGRSWTSLIRPASFWTDWSVEAETIHGLSRSKLESDGVPVDVIGTKLVENLSGHQLCASAPSWDGKWLSVLLRGAGFPRHALRLSKTDDVFRAAARETLPDASDAEITRLVADVITRSEPIAPAHRALPDAMLEFERWKAVKQAAISVL